MKPAKSLVMYLLFALPSFSQTALQTNPDSESILAARSQYSRSDTDPGQQKDANAPKVPLAQVPRGRTFRPPMRPPRMMGYSEGYPSMYTGDGSGRHKIIGALIGFGLGAALGARANTDRHPGADVKAAFAVGGIGALIGVAIGSSMPSLQSRNRHRGGRWPERDEDASLSQGRKRTHFAADRRTSPEKGVPDTVLVSSFLEPEAARPASE